jgi:hypothetical protein
MVILISFLTQPPHERTLTVGAAGCTLKVGAAGCTLKVGAAGCTLTSGQPAGCGLVGAGGVLGLRVASSPHATASHLPAPLIVAITFRASRPSGWLSCLLASHTATSYLPAPPPLIAPLPPLVTPISGLLSSWLRRRLSSRRCHLSAG